ncbi:hypothetical protein HGB07_04740 [Candidatus Roizmanbacteria bacterium]|nr:hypothetical protein [Candidatus Roizmanbacteria bacterium]
MANPELLDYIRQQHAAGKSKVEVFNALVSIGWDANTVREALSEVYLPSTTKLPNIDSIMKEVWLLYKAKFLLFIQLGIIFTLLSFGLDLFKAVILQVLTSFQLILAFITVWIFSIAINVWSMASAIYTATRNTDGVSVLEIIKSSSRYILTSWLVTVASGLIILVGSLLLLIPGLVFANWFTFSNILVFTEDCGVFTSLNRSKDYGKGNRWRICWLTIEFYLGLIGLVVTVALLLMIIPSFPYILLVKSIAFSILSILSLPAPILFLYVLYLNVKAIHDDSV